RQTGGAVVGVLRLAGRRRDAGDLRRGEVGGDDPADRWRHRVRIFAVAAGRRRRPIDDGCGVGPVSFIEVFNTATDAIRQGGVRRVWQMIAQLAWKSGEPGVIFIDRINAENPTPALGEMESTNPCGELPLLPFEACNLASINVGKLVVEDKLDWPRLAEPVAT